MLARLRSAWNVLLWVDNWEEHFTSASISLFSFFTNRIKISYTDFMKTEWKRALTAVAKILNGEWRFVIDAMNTHSLQAIKITFLFETSWPIKWRFKRFKICLKFRPLALKTTCNTPKHLKLGYRSDRIQNTKICIYLTHLSVNLTKNNVLHSLHGNPLQS